MVECPRCENTGSLFMIGEYPRTCGLCEGRGLVEPFDMKVLRFLGKWKHTVRVLESLTVKGNLRHHAII